MKSIICWMWSEPGAPAIPKPPDAPVIPEGTQFYTAKSTVLRTAPPPSQADPTESIDARQLRERRDRLRARYPDRKIPRIPRPPRPRGPILAKQRLPRLFDAEQVNVLQRMCARHMSEPHRFICIADSGEGLSPDVEWIETPPEARALASVRSPEGERFPSCYRRLWVFSEAARVLGDHILCTDIDAVVMASLMPLFDYPHDFVGWRPFRDWGAKLRFGGGSYLLRPGTRTKVWTDFVQNPQGAIAAARAAGYRGSDQAWMSYCLAGKEPYWPQNCGIYSVRDLGPGLALPPDARLVHFNGTTKPNHHASGHVAPVKWVLDHWR